MELNPLAPVIVRARAVSPAQEAAWFAAGKPRHGDTVDVSQWAPDTIQGYAEILDHGLRNETQGVVLHVNDGYYEGTKDFFTNGLAEPYGSEGVGAHFEIGGQQGTLTGEYADGPPYQFLPIDAVAWGGVESNAFAVHVEHAGFGYSRAEWLKVHYNMIGDSAYRVAWILSRYGLGAPKVSMTYPGPKGSNVWPHRAGGESWGGHICPASTQDGVDYFPYDVWEEMANKAHDTNWGGAQK